MRIALIAEGCYPYITGGVSTWCDQLVRGLADHEFDVVAITATSRIKPVLALPPNVKQVVPVPLWDYAARPRRAPGWVRERFLEIYTGLLASVLDTTAVQRGFDLALAELFAFAQIHGLSAVFREDAVVQVLLDEWRGRFPAVPIHVKDAIEATELMEHMLLPLASPVPQADVTHPVSNGLPALLALAAKWRYGTPMVMSEHGVYLRERYLGLQSVHYRWPVKTVLLGFMRRLCRTAYEAADIITPVNIFNRRWEVRLGADPDRIQTVYNGVDPDALPPVSADPHIPTVGWIGRIDPLKDLHTLVRSFATVHAALPDALLRIFGPVPAGNEEYAASVRGLVRDLGLESVVRFEGPVSSPQTAYSASTVVALSSISEGLPYTVMEAMMSRRATCSTDVGGVAEVAGDAGVVVPARDPEAFGEALLTLLTDRRHREDVANRARTRALEMFQLTSMLETFRGIYADLRRQPTPDASLLPVQHPVPQVSSAAGTGGRRRSLQLLRRAEASS